MAETTAERSRRCRNSGGRAPALLMTVVVLMSGCIGQPSSGFNHAAPLPAETVVAYTAVGSDSLHEALTGVRGRDGAPLWQTGIGGLTHAPPVVVGGVLYTEGETWQLQGTPGTPGRTPTDAIMAVRLRDGALLWRVYVPAIYVGLTADATSVLVAAGPAGLYALNPADGSIRWHQALPLVMDLQLRQPVAAAGVVVVNSADGELWAFQESDGAFLWQMSIDLQNIGMNQVAVYGNSWMFLFATALADGKPLKDGQPPQQYVMGTWDADAYDACCTVNHVSHEATVLGVSDQLVLVETDVPTDHLVALDARTGRVRWHSTHAFDSLFVASEPGSAPTIYGSHGDEVIVLPSSDGGEIWQTVLPGYQQGSFILGMIALGGTLFVMDFPPSCFSFRCSGPTNNRLAALDGATGAIYWWRDLPDGSLLGQAAPAA